MTVVHLKIHSFPICQWNPDLWPHKPGESYRFYRTQWQSDPVPCDACELIIAVFEANSPQISAEAVNIIRYWRKFQPPDNTSVQLSDFIAAYLRGRVAR